VKHPLDGIIGIPRQPPDPDVIFEFSITNEIIDFFQFGFYSMSRDVVYVIPKDVFDEIKDQITTGRYYLTFTYEGKLKKIEGPPIRKIRVLWEAA
jgi:hypothetical protein